MRTTKRLGLAAVAALAGTAFVGVASASATQICSANDTSGGLSPCTSPATGWLYGVDINSEDGIDGTTISGSVLATPMGTLTCSSTQMLGGGDSDGTNGSMSSVTMSSCGGPDGSCSIVLSPPYSFAMTDTPDESGSNGTIAVTIPPTGAITIECGPGFDCSVSGTLKGSLWNPGNPGAPDGSQSFLQAGFDSNSGSSLSGCGGSDTYTADYDIDAGNSSAGALYVY